MKKFSYKVLPMSAAWLVSVMAFGRTRASSGCGLNGSVLGALDTISSFYFKNSLRSPFQE
jgi:hypothetical protein